jgi:hypothetical protein
VSQGKYYVTIFTKNPDGSTSVYDNCILSNVYKNWEVADYELTDEKESKKFEKGEDIYVEM